MKVKIHYFVNVFPEIEPQPPGGAQDPVLKKQNKTLFAIIQMHSYLYPKDKTWVFYLYTFSKTKKRIVK